ncbi:putative quinol monooxygenase [Subtercola vilae]|uniref:Antibiotic biosynthesis monooxygenase n=1 Tax=Subtercola vilae TaxID=2056433 RepID=A0A4T2B9P6_9MICO|nr:antibiotic biosynthesis monooxygenase [Subtercola vilae]
MSEIHLTGELVCKTGEDALIVRRHLPEHVQRTRAEPGCVSFRVTPTEDPLIWSVEESFTDQRVFELHQTRVADSEWGRVTAGIERHYAIEGLPR